ncbi:MAG: hypothetical protein NDI61_14285 [Bdellovibrionaceae bacterium]|nr:hypothetical protein [Pseudobdellovibrionaceae bacterium]
MISVETSRCGMPVITKDGRYLASSVDPVREAEAWAHDCRASLGGVKAVAILGLGSGYHVRALMAQEPQLTILVIESDARVAEAVLRLMPEIPAKIVCVESDWSQLLDHERARALTHIPFVVARHAPSCQFDCLFYQRAEALILARDRAGFFLQLRDRPALLRSVARDKLEAIPVGPISIKTVLDVLRPDSAEEREVLMWKILGELVK